MPLRISPELSSLALVALLSGALFYHSLEGSMRSWSQSQWPRLTVEIVSAERRALGGDRFDPVVTTRFVRDGAIYRAPLSELRGGLTESNLQELLALYRVGSTLKVRQDPQTLTYLVPEPGFRWEWSYSALSGALFLAALFRFTRVLKRGGGTAQG